MTPTRPLPGENSTARQRRRRTKAQLAAQRRKAAWVAERYPRAWVNRNGDPRYRDDASRDLDTLEWIEKLEAQQVAHARAARRWLLVSRIGWLIMASAVLAYGAALLIVVGKAR